MHTSYCACICSMLQWIFCSCFKIFSIISISEMAFLRIKITISLSIAVMLLFLIFSDFIANHIFMESRCEGIIRITAISLHSCAYITACLITITVRKNLFCQPPRSLSNSLCVLALLYFYVRIKMYQQYQLLTQLPVIYSVNLQLPHTVLFRCFSVPFIIKA